MRKAITPIQTVIYRDGEYYVAQSLGVDVSSFGETRQEAADNIREALELYFEDSKQKPFTITEAELITTNLANA